MSAAIVFCLSWDKRWAAEAQERSARVNLMTDFRIGLQFLRRLRHFGGVLTALVATFLLAATPGALAAQTKPLAKVVIGYGSADGGVAVLGFAKEARLFEKHGLEAHS